MHYSEIFPEYPQMTMNWWARYGLEEAAMDRGDTGEMPAHDRLAALMRGEQVEVKFNDLTAEQQEIVTDALEEIWLIIDEGAVRHAADALEEAGVPDARSLIMKEIRKGTRK